MNHSPDITEFPGQNYGSDLTERSAFTGSGAARMVDLCESAHSGFDVALTTHARQWARSPDVYALVMQLIPKRLPAVTQSNLPLTQIHALLQLYWRLDCFPKPLVALLDAPLDAATAGLTSFGTHRVAGENYRFTLRPDNGIPAAGIAYALARTPSALTMDLALAGHSLNRAEAWAAGLVTHCIPASAFPAIVAALADGQPVDPLLDGLHEDPSPALVRIEGATPSPINISGAERAAIETLIAAARQMTVHDSLIATARVADALSRRTGQDEFISTDVLFSTPKTGDLQLPPRSQL